MHLRGNLMLLLAAFIWGTTFVAQMVGMDGLGPFTYAAARYILGLLFLVGLWYAWRGSREGAKRAGTYRPGWKAGLGAGCIMMVATSLQQVAMLYTTAGKTAFITALYIIFVPLGAVLLGKRIHPENWVGAAMALLGLYFLSIHGAVSLSFGDGLVFICNHGARLRTRYQGAVLLVCAVSEYLTGAAESDSLCSCKKLRA